MVAPWHIQNATSLQQALAGFEDGSGPATPTFRLMGDLTTTKTHELTARQEATGNYVRRANPRKGLPVLAGNYAQDLTFESLPQLQRAAIKSGATGVAVAGATGAFDYLKAPSLTRDDIELMTIQHNVEGLGFQAEGVRFPEHTITVDVDDADGVWKWASPLWIRDEIDLPGSFEGVATAATADTLTMAGATWTVDEHAGKWVVLRYLTGVGEVRPIVSNTATALTIEGEWDVTPTAGVTFRIEGAFEAGVPVVDEEPIPSYGTKVFIDPLGGIIGTTEIDNDRIISLNVTTQLNPERKTFLNNTAGVGRRMGRGELITTFQIRFEFDRRDEMLMWERMQGFKLRIEQEGSILDESPLTRKLARIDIFRAFWSQPTRDARGNNLTATMAGVAYNSTPYVQYLTRNGLATLA
jgi:hypothetical protein